MDGIDPICMASTTTSPWLVLMPWVCSSIGTPFASF
jgi:hypothetical protein